MILCHGLNALVVIAFSSVSLNFYLLPAVILSLLLSLTSVSIGTVNTAAELPKM